MKRKEKLDRNFIKQIRNLLQVSMVRSHDGIELNACWTCGWLQFHGCAETCLNYAEEEKEEEVAEAD